LSKTLVALAERKRKLSFLFALVNHFLAILLKDRAALAPGFLPRFVAARCASNRSRTPSSTTFCDLLLKRSRRSFRPLGSHLRRGAFLSEPAASRQLFSSSAFKKLSPVAGASFGVHLRRGAFLGEPAPFVNPFLHLLSKNFVARFGNMAGHLRRGAILGECRPRVNRFFAVAAMFCD
jgi:hypothetical protein